MINKHCEGCNAQGNSCSSNYNDDFSCPCMECVVKVICTVYCEKWSLWEYAEWCEQSGMDPEVDTGLMFGELPRKQKSSEEKEVTWID